MQKFNWSTVVAAVIICIGIIIAGNGIVTAINDRPFAGSAFVPDVFQIYNHDNSTEFLYEYEAANYLRIDEDTLYRWIQAGKLQGTYTTIELVGYDDNVQVVKMGTERIYSKAKLNEYMNSLIESGN
ncbi:MAG: helix-turn-helix domain-containing protein [Christensenellales bacterium]